MVLFALIVYGVAIAGGFFKASPTALGRTVLSGNRPFAFRPKDFNSWGAAVIVFATLVWFGSQSYVHHDSVLIMSAPDGAPEARLPANVAGADHDHPLLGLIGAVRGEGLLVAVRPGLGAVAEIAGQQRGLHHHRDLEHGEVDVSALAGPLALKNALAKAKASRPAA